MQGNVHPLSFQIWTTQIWRNLETYENKWILIYMYIEMGFELEIYEVQEMLWT